MYYNAEAKTALVVAESEAAALDFLGARDASPASPQISTVAQNVEVSGLDADHPALPPLAVGYDELHFTKEGLLRV
jgi:hypothetical protein